LVLTLSASQTKVNLQSDRIQVDHFGFHPQFTRNLPRFTSSALLPRAFCAKVEVREAANRSCTSSGASKCSGNLNHSTIGAHAAKKRRIR